DLGAALAAGLERPAGAQERPLLQRQAAADAERLAVGGEQLGLGVERLHVRHAAGGEQEDDALGLRREVGLLRRQRGVGGQQVVQDARQQGRAGHEGAEHGAAGGVSEGHRRISYPFRAGAAKREPQSTYTNSLLRNSARAKLSQAAPSPFTFARTFARYS